MFWTIGQFGGTYHPPEHSTRKWMVGRDEMSFWDGLFSGAMFSFREGKLFPVSSTIMQVENDNCLFQVPENAAE